jgi:hypothetical protein
MFMKLALLCTALSLVAGIAVAAVVVRQPLGVRARINRSNRKEGAALGLPARLLPSDFTEDPRLLLK